MVPFLSILKQQPVALCSKSADAQEAAPFAQGEHTYIGRLLEGSRIPNIIPWTASMPSPFTLFLGLATLLFGVFVSRSPFMMTTAPASGSKPWADQPMKLVATPQYESKKVWRTQLTVPGLRVPPTASATRRLIRTAAHHYRRTSLVQVQRIWRFCTTPSLEGTTAFTCKHHMSKMRTRRTSSATP